MEERHKMEQGGFLDETLRQMDKGDICFQDELDGQRGRMRRQSGLPQASPSYELYYDNLYTLRQSGTKRSATTKCYFKVFTQSQSKTRTSLYKVQQRVARQRLPLHIIYYERRLTVLSPPSGQSPLRAA